MTLNSLSVGSISITWHTARVRTYEQREPGSVRKPAVRMRITAQLVDAVAGTYIWAERYDRELRDIFAVQDEITERVAGAIEPKLLKSEGVRATARGTTNLTAWDLVRQGIWQFHQITQPSGSRRAMTSSLRTT
jgi:hypothetical protein